MLVRRYVFRDAVSEIRRRTGCGTPSVQERPRLPPREVARSFHPVLRDLWAARRGDVRSCSVPCSRLTPAWRMSTIAREGDWVLAAPLPTGQEPPKSPL